MKTHNRKSPRKQWRDYTSPGGYFITICTQDREHYFGEVVNGEMILNQLGKYTTDHRTRISGHYPFVTTDVFVCMPNHIHGILFIGERDEHQRSPGSQFFATDNGTYKNTSLDNCKPSNGIQPKSGSLGAIVRGFKIGVTKYAKQNAIPFKRQGRYHDLLVRNETEYENMSRYIINNPSNRGKDKFHS